MSNQGPVISHDSPFTPAPPGARPQPQPQPPARPTPRRKGKAKARAPPSPPPNPNEDPKYLIPYDNTKFGRAFGDHESWAYLFPHPYEAGEFPRGAYDIASFISGHGHPDHTPSPLYAYAASGSGSGGKTKKATKPPSPQHVASAAAPSVEKGLPSLPGAQRRCFAPRLSPVRHPDAPAIAATFPNIAARFVCESNCLLPRGFSVSVNVRRPSHSQLLTR